MPALPTLPPTRANWLAIISLGVIWGAAFMGMNLALRGFGPVTVAAGRLGVAALTLLLILWLRGGLGTALPRDGQRRLPYLVAIAILGAALPFFLLSWGQQYVTSGFAGITMAAIALFVLPLAHVFIPGDRLNGRKLLGFALGFAGVVVLIGPAALFAGGGMEKWGALACLGAAFCYASSSIVTRLCPPMDSLALATAQTVLAACLMVPLAWATEGAPATLATPAGLALLLLGIGPTALANLLRVSVVRSAGPSFLALTNYQVPIWSVIFSALFLAEPLPLRLLGALALILAGMAISQRLWRLWSPR